MPLTLPLTTPLIKDDELFEAIIYAARAMHHKLHRFSGNKTRLTRCPSPGANRICFKNFLRHTTTPRKSIPIKTCLLGVNRQKSSDTVMYMHISICIYMHIYAYKLFVCMFSLMSSSFQQKFYWNHTFYFNIKATGRIHCWTASRSIPTICKAYI